MKLLTSQIQAALETIAAYWEDAPAPKGTPSSGLPAPRKAGSKPPLPDHEMDRRMEADAIITGWCRVIIEDYDARPPSANTMVAKVASLHMQADLLAADEHIGESCLDELRSILRWLNPSPRIKARRCPQCGALAARLDDHYGLYWCGQCDQVSTPEQVEAGELAALRSTPMTVPEIASLSERLLGREYTARHIRRLLDKHRIAPESALDTPLRYRTNVLVSAMSAAMCYAAASGKNNADPHHVGAVA